MIVSCRFERVCFFSIEGEDLQVASVHLVSLVLALWSAGAMMFPVVLTLSGRKSVFLELFHQKYAKAHFFRIHL